MSTNYDLIVIGSGPAGEKGGAQAAYFGKRVALIEKERWVGGASINTGTVPSKTLRESALHLSGFRRREVDDAVNVTLRSDISVADFMRRKNRVVQRENEIIRANLVRHRIHRFRGTASFLSPHEIKVSNSEEESVLRGSVILIATGSSPFRPPGIPFDHRWVYDSDEILDLDRIPESLAVIGAGVIGCEYASIFSALGVKVTLIDGRKELLGHVDREIVGHLLRSFNHTFSIDLRLGADVAGIHPGDSNVRLVLADGSELLADKVLYAAGRQSNTADLNLEAAGVKTGRRGLIEVDEEYRTNVPHIFAAGDVIGFPALASTSMEQARVAMIHAFDLKYREGVAALLPYGIYTIPEVGMVGLTEAECRQKGLKYAVGRAWYRNNARGQIIADTEGLIKIIFEPDTLAIHGVHIVGENATEIVHVGMMVMLLNGTLKSFIDCVFNYPTLSDGYKYAAYDGLRAAVEMSRAKERPMLNKQVSDLIEGNPLVYTQVNQTVRAVAKHMAENSVGAVAVLDGEKLVGMFTERDLMNRVVARDLDPDKTGVGTVMTRDVAVAAPDETMQDAVLKMQSLNCRHLPVIDQGRLVGMISLRDLLQVDAKESHDKVDLLSELVTYSPDYES